MLCQIIFLIKIVITNPTFVFTNGWLDCLNIQRNWCNGSDGCWQYVLMDWSLKLTILNEKWFIFLMDGCNMVLDNIMAGYFLLMNGFNMFFQVLQVRISFGTNFTVKITLKWRFSSLKVIQLWSICKRLMYGVFTNGCLDCSLNIQRNWSNWLAGCWQYVLMDWSVKGQLISECLFDVLNFPKNQRKNLTNFCPRI